ncbi:MAG: hypothetical protein AAGI91_04915 [Bacteroidota bacterium]
MQPSSFLRGGLCVLALLALAAGAPDAAAQETVRSWTSDVKLDNGATAAWTTTIVYDASSGLYTRTITDASGAVVKQTTTDTAVVAPSDEEIARARALILGDAELGALYDRADNPTLSGGFVLVREKGHACAPGSRCLMFDMYDVEGRSAERIRFIVVDLGTDTIVSRDFDPARDSNETRFNRDRRTDSR